MVKNLVNVPVPGLPVTPPDMTIEDIETQTKLATIDGCLVIANNEMGAQIYTINNVIDEGDPWDVVNEVLPIDPKSKSWQEQNCTERLVSIVTVFIKFCLVLISLYLFVCSLSLLSTAFKLLGGKTAGAIFSKSELLNNPIVGLMIGVLVTVLVQSSSTSTSIIVAMVSAGIVPIKPAIYLVMGANIGTTVTNTIVSMGQSMDRKQFRRAFAGATVHDCFNWLCVAIFLPLEAIAHPLYHLSNYIVREISNDDTAVGGSKLDFLKKITKPLTKKVISINKHLITDIAKACSEGRDKDEYCIEKKNELMVKQCYEDTNKTIGASCGFLFSNTGMNDTAVGLILLFLSLFLLCSCLTVLVKTLQSLLMGRMARTLKKYINSDLPYPFGWLTGYIFIVVGTGMTILVQSSSVFTSAITPLVGVGVISLERMFPLTLGSNIGTTATAMLAALAAVSNQKFTIQIAVCHLFFNIFGILIWYPFPLLRDVPISAAKHLGNTTAKYRWFALAYLVLVFFVIPVILLGLSFNKWVLGVAIVLIIAFIVGVTLLNVLQKHVGPKLPKCIQTWNFLPRPMRSLAPYDEAFLKIYIFFSRKCSCRKFCPETSPDVSLVTTGNSTPKKDDVVLPMPVQQTQIH